MSRGRRYHDHADEAPSVPAPLPLFEGAAAVDMSGRHHEATEPQRVSAVGPIKSGGLVDHRPRETPQWYKDYLSTPRWRAIRQALIGRADHRCQSEGCYRRTHLQVHHLSYANLGNERLCDVKVLCDRCHGRAHGLPEVPLTRPPAESISTILERVIHGR